MIQRQSPKYSIEAERYFIPTKIRGEFRTFACNIRDISGIKFDAIIDHEKKRAGAGAGLASSAGAGAGLASSAGAGAGAGLASAGAGAGASSDKYYPYGYIAYLLRVYGYNISSIIPRISVGRINFPITITYDIDAKSVDYDYKELKDGKDIINNIPSRYVFMNVLENIKKRNTLTTSNMFIFIDKEKFNVDILINIFPDVSQENRITYIKDFINYFIETRYNVNVRQSDDKLSLEEKINLNLNIDPTVNLYNLILLHHKILNPSLSMVEINTKVLGLITTNNWDIKVFMYLYYKKINALSNDKRGDLTLLYAYF